MFSLRRWMNEKQWRRLEALKMKCSLRFTNLRNSGADDNKEKQDNRMHCGRVSLVNK